MGLNTNVFQEPRGVMRIIQFIFAICAFATTVDFSNELTISYCDECFRHSPVEIKYPFELDRMNVKLEPCTQNASYNALRLYGDFSSDAQFFVATGVLSMLYCIGISGVYLLFDTSYQSNALVPMADFMLTVLLAVFWLSGSAAWANGVDGLKSVLSPDNIKHLNESIDNFCKAYVGSFSGLNISVILGFLNFFLWASDLWFLYKETQWFKNANPPTSAASPGFQ